MASGLIAVTASASITLNLVLVRDLQLQEQAAKLWVQADEKAMSDLKSAHAAEYDQLKKQHKDKMDQGGSA